MNVFLYHGHDSILNFEILKSRFKHNINARYEFDNNGLPIFRENLFDFL